MVNGQGGCDNNQGPTELHRLCLPVQQCRGGCDRERALLRRHPQRDSDQPDKKTYVIRMFLEVWDGEKYITENYVLSIFLAVQKFCVRVYC